MQFTGIFIFISRLKTTTQFLGRGFQLIVFSQNAKSETKNHNTRSGLWFFILLSLLTVFFHHKPVFAEEVKAASDSARAEVDAVKTEYQAEYFLNDKIQNLETKVKFNIKSTFYRSDVVIDNIGFLFPENFSIRNLAAYDDNGPITPVVSPLDKQIKVDLHFSNPKFGKGIENNISLEFQQDNLFKVSGSVWEVILPTFVNTGGSSYKVIINLPPDSGKKISISKPKPDVISGNKIVWNNVKTKTIYAVFGDRQNYQAVLTYNLKNPDILPSYSYVAFPPDTLRQKIYLNSISPPPVSVETDQDGNYLAKYLLKPKENKTITFKGIFEIFSLPREETIPYFKIDNFDPNKELLQSNKYWNIGQSVNFANFTNPEGIYQFVTQNLHYDYNRINQNVRYGAENILKNRNSATCIDFSDLFIALARKNNIRAREVEGYALSQDKILRPLSLVVDVLHAWPEYYDPEKNIWIPVDPTWGATSGIDYFSSFDLNHLAFVIHGRDPEYPLSAGMYKTTDTKDISITVTNIKPKENVSLKIMNYDLKVDINDRDTYKAKFILKNESNVYLWNYPLEFKGENLEIIGGDISLYNFPPYEIREIPIQYKSNSLVTPKKIDFVILAKNMPIFQKKIQIKSFYLEAIQNNVFVFGLILILASFGIILRKRRRK